MSEPLTESPTATLRRFNRAWSQRVGALDESFLGTGRSLGASRLLFEIGERGRAGESVPVLELRRRLGLDSGYLSRLLRLLEADGLVKLSEDPRDRRRRVVALSARGRRARATLDERSERLAQALLAPLGAAQRARLRDALATADRLLRAATVAVDRVEPDSAEATAAVQRYFAELDQRFPGGFDPGDAALRDVAGMSAPSGSFLVGRVEDDVVACGGVQPVSRDVVEIKRMWVHPEWRGCGLGARMLAGLEDEVRRLGYREVYLDTNNTLVEAVSMYQRAGYRSIARYNDNPYAVHWFAKRLD